MGTTIVSKGPGGELVSDARDEYMTAHPEMRRCLLSSAGMTPMEKRPLSAKELKMLGFSLYQLARQA
jgi:hypothetical protein